MIYNSDRHLLTVATMDMVVSSRIDATVIYYPVHTVMYCSSVRATRQ
jgi:hypothetical protein